MLTEIITLSLHKELLKWYPVNVLIKLKFADWICKTEFPKKNITLKYIFRGNQIYFKLILLLNILLKHYH